VFENGLVVLLGAGKKLLNYVHMKEAFLRL
jgi:hypothetical protein